MHAECHHSRYKHFSAYVQTIYGCYSFLNQKKSGYSEYIACPVCHLLYDKQLIPTTFSIRQEIPKCTYIEFPNHPQLRFRMPCNELLLSVVKKVDKRLRLNLEESTITMG